MRTELNPITIAYVRVFSDVSIFDFEIPNIYCLLSVTGSFFDKEDNFPLEDGLTAGNYSTFFNEFFLIKVGLFPTFLTSTYS